MSLFDLTGKVAVITGASSGLGADAAIAYAENGADVAILARRKDKLEALAEEIRKTGRRALPIVCDVTDEKNIQEAVAEIISEYGKIDILLNNAGVAVSGTVEQIPSEEWDWEMNVNVKGYYLMSKYIVPHMRQQKYGRIVNIASVNAVIADKVPVLARHAYNTSKAAVIGLTLGMAASYAIDNITVNAIGPGLFESEMTQDTLFANQQFVQTYNALTPAGRAGHRGELNGTIIYFSSNACSYVTGQHIVVDGGTTIV